MTTCETCGKQAELRPYGLNGENICFHCMKTTPGAEGNAKRILDAMWSGGGHVVIDRGGKLRKPTYQEAVLIQELAELGDEGAPTMTRTRSYTAKLGWTKPERQRLKCEYVRPAAFKTALTVTRRRSASCTKIRTSCGPSIGARRFMGRS